MTDLKLIALEAEDLQIVSAHMQDAVIKVGDIAYLPKERRFAALFNRFDWSEVRAELLEGTQKDRSQPFIRRRTALRFEGVTAARLKNIDLKDQKRVLNLLAIQFERQEPENPAGFVSLIFAGDAAIGLDVECIEVEMRDLGGAWSTTAIPDHEGTK